jgi:hypothetical protein
MKKSAILITFLGLCLFSATGAELEKPTANLTERFVTASGWTAAADALVVAGWTTNECLAVQYATRNPAANMPQIAKVMCGANASSGIFSGDLSKMDAVSVDVRKKDLLYVPSLNLVSGSGAKWSYSLDAVSAMANDVWTTITLPVAFNADTSKCWSAPNGRTAQDFAADITNVVEIAFSTLRDGNGNYAQSFEVDNVKLIGPWGTNLVGGIPIAWAYEYGLTNNLDTVSTNDADHDGFNNFAEFLAGTNPTDSNSFFRVEIGRNQDGALVVKWNDNKNMKYTLLESTDLVNFGTVTSRQGSGTQQSVMVNGADVTGVRFYKVQISR